MRNRIGARIWFGIGLLAIAVGVPALNNGLQFGLVRDEELFWEGILHFSGHPHPTLELIRNLPLPHTPLLYIFWGYFERWTQSAVIAGRWINWAATLATLVLIAMPFHLSRGKAALGLLLCPYFIFTGYHLYTDPIPNFIGLLAVVFHFRKNFGASAVMSVLAISMRQYLFVVPAALLMYEIWGPSPNRPKNSARWMAPLIGCLTLFAWFLVYGGKFGPESSAIFMDEKITIHPDYSLYGLACIGLYYFVFEFMLWPRSFEIEHSKRNIAIVLGLALLFLAFPPLQNHMLPPTMGALDVAARVYLPWDPLRIAFFWSLACLAAIRLLREPRGFAFWLVLIHIAILATQKSTWDKYALPVLVLLWFNRRSASDYDRGAELPAGVSATTRSK